MQTRSCLRNDSQELLARIYMLILSWPEPEYENETAASENFDQDAEPAVIETPTEVEDAF